METNKSTEKKIAKVVTDIVQRKMINFSKADLVDGFGAKRVSSEILKLF